MSVNKGSAKLIAGAAVAVAVAGFGGWQWYQSPNQVAGRLLKQAAQARAEGHVLQAAQLYGQVAASPAEVAVQGASGLGELLNVATLQALPPLDAAKVLQQAQAARAAGHPPVPATTVLELGWQLVQVTAPKDAAGAKALLDAIKPIEADKAKWLAAAEPLLARIVEANPKDAPAAIELAVILDQRHDCARCEALLAPNAAALGNGEGARILGQVYAAKGRVDESYALLQPYTEEKLKGFVKLQDEYTALIKSIEKDSIEALRHNQAPADFYTRYDAADEGAKRELVSGFVDERMKGSGELRAKVQALRAASAIVPVALDLGIVTVQRAQTLPDPSARNAQFQAAEKVFLSIRGAAGDTDGYRLYLGQVDYWLGKQAEGRKLFDELLAAHDRDPHVMLKIGAVLRSVGSVEEARGLEEEVFAKAKDNETRWGAAFMRSLLAIDAEDELVWLQRSDQNDPGIRASVHSARGQLAQRKGQKLVARREFEQAIEAYSKQPENAAVLNNTALVHLSLYGMDGDAKDRDAGIAKLDQALALMPTDSILLTNNLAAVSTAAAAGLLAPRIDLPLLHRSGDYELMEFLYDDEASRLRMQQAVVADAGVRKALSYSEKAILLAPRAPRNFGFPGTIASLSDDVPTMKAIAARATAARLDKSEAVEGLRKLRDPAEQAKRVDSARALSKDAAALMAEPAVRRNPATWAVAVHDWVQHQLTLQRLGQPFDADGVVKAAREARAAAPSDGTMRLLMDALEGRAAMHLAKANPTFGATLAKHGLLVDTSTLLGLQMDEDAEFRKQMLADPDIVELMAQLRARDARYTSRTSPLAWMYARHTDPAYAETLATRLRKDATYEAYYDMTWAVESPSAEAVIHRFQYALSIGDRAGAQHWLDQAHKDGVELPDLLGRQLKG